MNIIKHFKDDVACNFDKINIKILKIIAPYYKLLVVNYYLYFKLTIYIIYYLIFYIIPTT